MAGRDDERTHKADDLYERFGRPLESEHWGEFVAIMPDGRMVLAPTLLAALERAATSFEPGGFVFKVGERVVGRIR